MRDNTINVCLAILCKYFPTVIATVYRLQRVLGQFLVTRPSNGPSANANSFRKRTYMHYAKHSCQVTRDQIAGRTNASSSIQSKSTSATAARERRNCDGELKRAPLKKFGTWFALRRDHLSATSPTHCFTISLYARLPSGVATLIFSLPGFFFFLFLF